MKKPQTSPAAMPQVLGTSMEGFKQDVAALMSPLQEVWGEIRKEIGSGEKVKAAVQQSGLDETWSHLKQAAATVVEPWLTLATPAAPTTSAKPTTAATPTEPRRRQAGKKAVGQTARKVARKVAGKVAAVKKKGAKKAR